MVKARYGLLFFPSEWVRAFRGLVAVWRGSPACNRVALVALMKRDRQRGEGQKQGGHVVALGTLLGSGQEWQLLKWGRQ